MGRLLAGLGSAFGLAWLWRKLQRDDAPPPDPASELRAKLEEARGAADDRDEYDAAEGRPVDEVEQPPPAAAAPEPPVEQTLSLDERRRAVHEKAQQALGEMDQLGRDE
jgi:hypothetical protein